MFRNIPSRAALLSTAFAVITGTATCNTNVLLDDFNDGNYNGWTVHCGTWMITNGMLSGHGAGHNIDGWVYTGDPNWSDFIYEADVLFESGNAEFAIRSTGHWSNEYRFVLWSEDSSSYPNRYCLMSWRDNVYTLHTDGGPIYGGNALSPTPITTDSHVRIEATGSLLSFYVNETLIYQFDDPDPILNGQVGLGVIWD